MTVQAEKKKSDQAKGYKYSYCSAKPAPAKPIPPAVTGERAALIISLQNKWVNGTVLHYYFFDRADEGKDGEYVINETGDRDWRTWTTSDKQKDSVREAFKVWEAVGIGLSFEEVQRREDAEIRIGFMQGDGAWSYVGRDILSHGKDERTMNFGWDISDDVDTAVHEIGHTLDFPHEHQNPFAGIVWDEEKVYESLAQPPNSWDREQTYYNIIRKIKADTVQGSSWDPNSIMHYPFEPGLILKPESYATAGLQPAGGLSKRDKAWVKKFYPAEAAKKTVKMEPFKSVPLSLKSGEQMNLEFKPTESRYHEFRTFGKSDAVIVLYEKHADGQLTYVSADDDSGEDKNAYLKVKLVKGREYVVRVRINWTENPSNTAVMVW